MVTAGATGWWARLLLLACTLFGLAAMHTIGHGTHSAGSHPGEHRVALALPAAVPAAHRAAMPEPASVGAVAHGAAMRAAVDAAGHDTTTGLDAAVDDCAGDHCGHTSALPAGDAGGRPDGWSVCLAVLSALAVTLLLAALLLGRARPAPGGRRPVRPSSGRRAPPGRPVGLRLATVSVLRR